MNKSRNLRRGYDLRKNVSVQLLARERKITNIHVSEVNVVRRWPRMRREVMVSPVSPGTIAEIFSNTAGQQTLPKIKIVAVGASTGSPVALQTILAALPKSFPPPALIVQRIAAGFTQGFVDWAQQTSALPVYMASCGEYLLSGHACVAPEGFHVGVKDD